VPYRYEAPLACCVLCGMMQAALRSVRLTLSIPLVALSFELGALLREISMAGVS